MIAKQVNSEIICEIHYEIGLCVATFSYIKSRQGQCDKPCFKRDKPCFQRDKPRLRCSRTTQILTIVNSRTQSDTSAYVVRGVTYVVRDELCKQATRYQHYLGRPSANVNGKSLKTCHCLLSKTGCSVVLAPVAS